MKIGIIGAMQIEVEKLKKMMCDVTIHKISSIEFYEGMLSDVPVVVAVAGVGKVNAAVCAQTMILKFTPDIVINVGVAGGLSEQLKVGDIAVATSTVEHDMDSSPLGDPLGYITGINLVRVPCTEWVSDALYQVASNVAHISTVKGIIASGDQFINSKEKKEWIVKNFDAVATEMEGASIGHVCYMNKVQFGVLRAISDAADDESHLSFQEFTEVAAENSIIIILSFIEVVKKQKKK